MYLDYRYIPQKKRIIITKKVIANIIAFFFFFLKNDILAWDMTTLYHTTSFFSHLYLHVFGIEVIQMSGKVISYIKNVSNLIQV